MGEKGELKAKPVNPVEELHEILKKDPKNIRVWIDLGMRYTIEGEKKKAYDTFKEGLEHNPEAWEIWEKWGNFFMKKRDFCRAYTCFYKALELLKSKKEEIPLNYHFNLVKALSNLPKGDPVINIRKARLYLQDLYEEITDPKKRAEIKCIEGSLLLQLTSPSIKSNPLAYDFCKEASFCFEEAVEIEDPRKKIAVWYNKGLVSLLLQEGKPQDWLEESEKSFNKVLEILEEIGQKNSETEADALFYIGLTKKDSSDFNPSTDPNYGDKEKRIKDLEESKGYLTRSHNILKELIDQELASSDNIFSVVEKVLGEINEELKRLKGETFPDYSEKEEIKEEEPYPRYIY